MRALAAITIAMLLATGATQTHARRAFGGRDYPFECCSEADRAQIDVSEVRETPSGFVVTIMPGRHPMWVTKRRQPAVLEIPYQKARCSPDGFFHLCMNGAGELRCFFAPAGDA